MPWPCACVRAEGRDTNERAPPADSGARSVWAAPGSGLPEAPAATRQARGPRGRAAPRPHPGPDGGADPAAPNATVPEALVRADHGALVPLQACPLSTVSSPPARAAERGGISFNFLRLNDIRAHSGTRVTSVSRLLIHAAVTTGAQTSEGPRLHLVWTYMHPEGGSLTCSAARGCQPPPPRPSTWRGRRLSPLLFDVVLEVLAR